MRRGRRQRIPKVNATRQLVGGEPGRGPGFERRLVCLQSGPQNHDGNHLVLQQSRRHTDDSSLLNRRVREQRVLHLGRRDILAAPSDHLLEAPFQEHVALVVAESGIARAKPAVLDRGGGHIGRVPVSGGHHRVAKAELADLARSGIAAFQPHDAQLVLERARRGLPGAPDTAGLHSRGRTLRTAERVLTHPIAGQDIGPPNQPRPPLRSQQDVEESSRLLQVGNQKAGSQSQEDERDNSQAEQKEVSLEVPHLNQS